MGDLQRSIKACGSSLLILKQGMSVTCKIKLTHSHGISGVSQLIQNWRPLTFLFHTALLRGLQPSVHVLHKVLQ